MNHSRQGGLQCWLTNYKDQLSDDYSNQFWFQLIGHWVKHLEPCLLQHCKFTGATHPVAATEIDSKLGLHEGQHTHSALHWALYLTASCSYGSTDYISSSDIQEMLPVSLLWCFLLLPHQVHGAFCNITGIFAINRYTPVVWRRCSWQQCVLISMHGTDSWGCTVTWLWHFPNTLTGIRGTADRFQHLPGCWGSSQLSLHTKHSIWSPDLMV